MESLTETVSKIGTLGDEQRERIENCDEATDVCEWWADECLGDPEMEECAESCRKMANA